MRLLRAHVDGFGGLAGSDFEFGPGLNVIAGPNEAGKSTLHAFLVGMLYGLKKPDQPHRRAFEEAFEKYRPWTGTRYGGRLEYELADGARFEVYRRFSRRGGEVKVHALPGGADCTGDFPRLKNGEVQFAQAHLGLGKRLFTSAACIRHATVGLLAPEEQLNAVRDRIAAIIDTGREDTSGKQALKILDEQAQAIGSDRARTKPVAQLRERLKALKAERQAVAAARGELAALSRRRSALVGRIEELTDRLGAARRLLDAARRAELAATLDALHRADAEVARLDRELEALAPYADYPADRHPRLIELKREEELHREGLQRLRERSADLAAHLERLAADLEAVRQAAELPQNALEVMSEQVAHLADAEHRVALAVEQERELAAEEEAACRRLAPLENRRHEVAAFLDAGEDALGELWHLEETIETTRRELHEAQVAGENLHVHAGQLDEQLSPLAPIFQGVSADIDDLRSRWEASQRAFETIRQEIAPELNRRRAHRFELGATIQQHVAFGWIAAVLSAILIAGPLALGLSIRNYYALGGVGLLVMAAFFFGRQWAMARTLRRVEAEVAAYEDRLAEEKARVEGHAGVVSRLLEASPYRTLGEYISAYGTYLRLREAHREAAQSEHQSALDAQEVRDRLQSAHARVQAILSGVAIPLASLDDLPQAVTRYRDGYRHARQALDDVKDARRDLESVSQRRGAVARQLDADRRECDEAAGRLRHLCRQAGIDPAAGLGPAVEEFKSRFRRARALLTQMEEVAARRADVEAQVAQSERAAETAARETRAILEAAGVETVEEFRVGLERRERRRALAAERAVAAERRQHVLAGRSEAALAAELAALGPGPEEGAAPAVVSLHRADDLRRALEADQAELAQAREELADLSARIEAHLAPMRDLSAIDEDLAAAQARLDRLLLARQAIDLARQTIEQVGRSVYASVAPRLNEALGRTVGLITAGRYEEVTVDEDLSVWVRVPETGRRLPPQAFSRGALDQFYFTLRLGVVDLLTAHREPVPLILDDPFTNYDDERLSRAMALLAQRAQANQVLLFTCQERIGDSALAAGARALGLEA